MDGLCCLGGVRFLALSMPARQLGGGGLEAGGAGHRGAGGLFHLARFVAHLIQIG